MHSPLESSASENRVMADVQRGEHFLGFYCSSFYLFYRSSLTEVCALTDVLKVANSTSYLAMSKSEAPEPYENSLMTVFAGKKMVQFLF